MELTGERVVPEFMKPSNGLLKEHIARYDFASKVVSGRVLDIACGVGYGSCILAESKAVREVLAVDNDEKTIDYARQRYNHQKVSYVQALAEDKMLSQRIGKFDTIVSMETIEHIQDDFGFVDNLLTLLKPGGTAIISTPFGRGRNVRCANPFHHRQYTEDEFKELLDPFEEIKMYYQLQEIIEKPKFGKKYYLMVAVCRGCNI